MNGTHSCSSEQLLLSDLKKSMNFTGFVMSDCKEISVLASMNGTISIARRCIHEELRVLCIGEVSTRICGETSTLVHKVNFGDTDVFV